MEDPEEISQQAKMRKIILSEDDTLKYDFMISLKKIVMTKIVGSLWINPNTQEQIVRFKPLGMLFHKVMPKVQDSIVAKVSQLLLPNVICQELINLVPILGHFIVDWIDYHNDYILTNPDESEYSAEDFIHNIAWTARGKIDYFQTAKNMLTNSSILLTDEDKYTLACNYCLEKEISSFPSTLVKKFYLSHLEFDKNPMVYFWTAHITGDRTLLENPRYCYPPIWQHMRDKSIYEQSMRLLVKNFRRTYNDIPIRFLWDKLSKEEKIKNIALFQHIRNPELIISLFSNLDYDLQQKFLKECFVELLGAIFADWWWSKKYFTPTVLHALDNMDSSSYWRVLDKFNDMKEVSLGGNTYNDFKFIYKLLWREGSTSLKECIFRDKESELKEFVVCDLDWERDVDVIEVIFKDLNTQQKKNIAFGVDGINLCASFIQNDEWDLLHLFINFTLSSEEDISQLKQRLMQDKGREIAICFLEKRKFHKMEHFLKWAFKTEEEMSHFRQSLSHGN